MLAGSPLPLSGRVPSLARPELQSRYWVGAGFSSHPDLCVEPPPGAQWGRLGPPAMATSVAYSRFAESLVTDPWNWFDPGGRGRLAGTWWGRMAAAGANGLPACRVNSGERGLAPRRVRESRHWEAGASLRSITATSSRHPPLSRCCAAPFQIQSRKNIANTGTVCCGVA